MSDQLKSTFWDRISDVRAGLLSAGDKRAVPMSPYARPDDNALWFITAKGTDVAKAAQGSAAATFAIADSGAKLYGTVEGQIAAVEDRSKLDEIWNAMAAAWFEDGKEDDDIQLVRMTPTTAEIWATDGAPSFLYEVAKANLTDSTPDAGDHGVVSFAA
ncbi:pyridoxamine 5'-phosphate oxidase family protein [Thalassococcus sp. BH17M4-6]|uniref:pyridoxamine 5'-phosphate oxidase family protein n=1 Tax=Thalassococcus sp. BH17M4-6 TaxID=3413148 RepID=UPI003BD3D5BA